MARIVKFSLIMKDGYHVEKNIEEMREYFDLERVLSYFHDGKLQRWLKINGYREEADQIAELSEGTQLVQNLCQILGVEVKNDVSSDVDVEAFKDKSVRLRRLKQYTTDNEILKLVESVAFSQDELDALIDEGAVKIVLCDARFIIPLQVQGTKYYGVGRAVAVIESDMVVDFVAQHIEFYGVAFDERYQRLLEFNKKQADKVTAEEEKRHRQESERHQKFLQAQKYYEDGDACCVKLFEELANEGDIDAIDMLGNWYYDKKKGNDVKRAFLWVQKQVAAGDMYAGTILGRFYADGIGTQKDLQKAAECYKYAAEQNEPLGMRRLGRCYQDGNGVEKDEEKAAAWYKKAFMWYRKAAESGDVKAMKELAKCYLGTLGVEEDAKKAVFWRNKAATMGDVEAMMDLAAHYQSACGVEQDVDKTLFWYQKAAEMGNAHAMLQAGLCLQDEGRYEEARDWYEKVAEIETEGLEETKGFALDLLGQMYLNGCLGLGQEAVAVYYFDKAADLNWEQGLYHLGECYEFGRGVEKNRKYAKRLYERAATLGDLMAQMRLDEWKREPSPLMEGILDLFS